LRARDRDAYVAPAGTELLVVCDRKCDMQDMDEVASLALTLAVVTEGPALAVLNHDDDVLLFGLYGPAGLVSEFGWTNGSGWEVPKTDRGQFLAEVRKAFGTQPRATRSSADPRSFALSVLRWMSSRYFAVSVHDRIAAEAGLPECSVGAGFRYVEGRSVSGHDAFVRV
jgi:hypothetical protein